MAASTALQVKNAIKAWQQAITQTDSAKIAWTNALTAESSAEDAALQTLLALAGFTSADSASVKIGADTFLVAAKPRSPSDQSLKISAIKVIEI